MFSVDSTSTTGAATVVPGTVAATLLVVEFFCRTNALISEPTRNANTELTNVMMLNGIEPSGMGMLSNTGSLTRNNGVSVIR